MNDIILQIKLWLGVNRPELKPNGREALAYSIYQDIQTEIENLEDGAKLIYIQEFLNLNYLKSAYNLVKDIFHEYFPKEFSNFQKSPIFYEVNDEILEKCVVENVFKNKYQLISPSSYFNNDFRERISNVIAQII